MQDNTQDKIKPPSSPTPQTAVAHWRAWLTSIAVGYLLFETLSGLGIWLLPFSRLAQFSVLIHTAVGIIVLLPVAWYMVWHTWVRRKGNLSHYQLLGYIAVALTTICLVSGIVVTYQGVVGPRMDYVWELLHLGSGLGLAFFVVVHIATVVVRKVNQPEARRQLGAARAAFYRRSLAICLGALAVCGIWMFAYTNPAMVRSFPADYNWRFGDDRPFAPSMAKIDHSQWSDTVQRQVLAVVGDEHRDAVLTLLSNHSDSAQGDPAKGLFDKLRTCTATANLDEEQQRQLEQTLVGAAEEMKRSGALQGSELAGSASCGTSGCHTQIYQEWLPSAHRYAAMDDMFQRVQTLMADETSPEHTRYCAGCHDPISLFSGAKNSGNITLSAAGADEGISCLVCHSIAQADVQGNGDFTIAPPQRYVYEQHEGKLAKLISDFLIRVYPQHHVTSYSRPLYKTAEFCGACHKQYLDKEVNTDIGKVQGQNQYDSWKNSKWHHEGDATKTISCRECHMPLANSHDPARGDATDYNRHLDDQQHRSHRTLGGNQYIPEMHQLEGHAEHIKLTEKWLRGEIEIPEIVDKWIGGPVVRMEIIAPEQAAPDEQLALQVVLTNNKTGHDFPTGPLDMIESWVELTVSDAEGNKIYHTGSVGENDQVQDAQVWFKADGFDRKRQLIDRHNLWDLVGASYKRSLYPGVTDSVAIEFQCPSMARGRVIGNSDKQAPGSRSQSYSLPAPASTAGSELIVEAVLWYRKANPEFLNRVYGELADVRSPITEINRATARIRINDGTTSSE